MIRKHIATNNDWLTEYQNRTVFLVLVVLWCPNTLQVDRLFLWGKCAYYLQVIMRLVTCWFYLKFIVKFFCYFCCFCFFAPPTPSYASRVRSMLLIGPLWLILMLMLSFFLSFQILLKLLHVHNLGLTAETVKYVSDGKTFFFCCCCCRLGSRALSVLIVFRKDFWVFTLKWSLFFIIIIIFFNFLAHFCLFWGKVFELWLRFRLELFGKQWWSPFWSYQRVFWCK